jgi:hypothetical protein
MLSQGMRWCSAWAVLYPVAVCFIAITKFLVLDRLMDFSKLNENRRWLLFSRGSVWLFVAGNIAGFVSNIAACVYFARAADMKDIRTNSSNRDSMTALKQGSFAASIFVSFETISLILIVIAFLIFGYASTRRISASVKLSNKLLLSRLRQHGQDLEVPDLEVPSIQKLNRRIVYTCIVVFLSFVLRAIFMSVFCTSAALTSNPADCPEEKFENRCSDCYNIYYYIMLWILYSPEAYFGVILVSQPLTLLFLLWAMTSGRMSLFIRG